MGLWQRLKKKVREWVSGGSNNTSAKASAPRVAPPTPRAIYNNRDSRNQTVSSSFNKRSFLDSFKSGSSSEQKEEKRVQDYFKASDYSSKYKSLVGNDNNDNKESSFQRLDKALKKDVPDPKEAARQNVYNKRQEKLKSNYEQRKANREERQAYRQEKHEAYHEATHHRYDVGEKGISKEERDRRKQNIRTATLGEMMGGREDEAADVMKAKMKYDKVRTSVERGVANTASAGTINLAEKRLAKGERKKAEEIYQENKSKGGEAVGSLLGGLALYGGTAGTFEGLGTKAVGRAATTEVGKRLGAKKLSQIMAGEGAKAALTRSLVGDAIQDSTIGAVDTTMDILGRDDLETAGDYAKAWFGGQALNYGMGLFGNAASHGLPVAGRVVGRKIGDFIDDSRKLRVVPKGVADVAEATSGSAKATPPKPTYKTVISDNLDEGTRNALREESRDLRVEYDAIAKSIEDDYGSINPDYRTLTPEQQADIRERKGVMQEITARRNEIVEELRIVRRVEEPSNVELEARANGADVDVPENQVYNNIQEGADNGTEIGNLRTAQAGGETVSAVDADVSRGAGEYSEAMGGVADASSNAGRRSGVGVLRISEENRAKLTESGVTDTHLSDVSDNYAAFSNALDEARAANGHGGYVDSQSVDALTASNAKALLSDDGYAGVAVKSDGDICGVFKNPASKHKGAVYDLIYTARANGGTKMDCYGQALVNRYEAVGYVPVARIPFNAEYVTDPKLLDARPDVYVLMKNTDDLDAVASKIRKSEQAGGYHRSTQEELDNLPSFDDYDEALAFRDGLLAKQEASVKTKTKTKKGKTKTAKAESVSGTEAETAAKAEDETKPATETKTNTKAKKNKGAKSEAPTPPSPKAEAAKGVKSAAEKRYDELVAERKAIMDEVFSKNERSDPAAIQRINEINEELDRIKPSKASKKASKKAKSEEPKQETKLPETRAEAPETKGVKEAAETLEPKAEKATKASKTKKYEVQVEDSNGNFHKVTVEAESSPKARRAAMAKVEESLEHDVSVVEGKTLGRVDGEAKAETKVASPETEPPKAAVEDVEIESANAAKSFKRRKKVSERLFEENPLATEFYEADKNGQWVFGRDKTGELFVGNPRGEFQYFGKLTRENYDKAKQAFDDGNFEPFVSKSKKGAKPAAENLEPKAEKTKSKKSSKGVKAEPEKKTVDEIYGEDYAVLKEKLDEADRLRGRVRVAQGANKEALQGQLDALEKEIQFDKDFADFRRKVGNAKTDIAELENKLRVAEGKDAKAAIRKQIKDIKSDVKKAYNKAGLRHHPDKGGSAERMARFNEEYDLFANGGKGGNASKGKTPEPNRTVENVESMVHKTKEQESAKEDVKGALQAARRSTTNSMVTFEDENLKIVKTNHEKWKIRNALIDKARRFKHLAVRSIDKAQLRADGTRYSGTVERIGADGKTYKIENGKSLKQIYSGMDETTEAKFDAYLLLRHAPDRIREATPIFKRINLVGEDGSVIKSLDDPEVVKEYADKLLKENPDFARRAEEVYQYEQNELENRVRAGLLSQKKASEWAHDHPFYVPTGRDGYFNAFHGNHKGVIGADSLKAATGSDLDIRSIKEQLAEATSRNWRDITTNELLEEFFGSEVKAGRADTKGLKLLNETVGLSKSADGSKFYAKIFRDGKAHRVEIDRNYYLDLQDLYKNGRLGGDGGIGDAMDTVARATSKFSSPFKKLVTTWNPIFLPKNFSRDFQDALINTRQTKEFVECLAPAWKELSNGGEYARAFEDSGVSQANFVNLDEAFNGKGGKLGAAVDKFIALQDMTESFPRLAEYMATLKKAGVDISKPLSEQKVDPRLLDIAAANAADVTVNFSRSGSVGKNLNKGLVPFLNPSIQGWSKFIRNFREQKGTKQLLGTIAKAYTLGAGVMAINNFLLSDNPNYQQISNREKANNIIIPIPPLQDGHINDDADTFIKIPRGRFAAVYGLSTVNAFNENDMGWAEMIKVARDAVLPVDPTESSIFSPLYAAHKNETWYGAPIESDYLKENFSPSERYDERTTPLGKALGKATSGLPEELQISPKKFDYIADAATGVMGDFGLPMSTALGNGNGLSGVKDAGVGVLKKAFTIDSATQSGLYSQYNDEASRLTHKKNAANASEADKKAYDKFNSWDSRVKAASNAMRYVQNSDMPNKQEAYRELAKLRNENMQKALDGRRSLNNSKDIDIIHKYAGTSYTIENLGKSADQKALKAYSAAVYGNLSEDEMRKKIDSDTEFYKGYSGIVKTQNALQKVGPKLKGGNALTYAVGLADAGANNDVFASYGTTVKSRTESASKAERAKTYLNNNGSVEEFAQLENAVKNLGKLSDVDKGRLEDEAYAKLQSGKMSIDEYNTELKKIDYNANQSYVGKAVSLAQSGAPARAYNLYDIKAKNVQKGYNLAAMGIDSRKYREMSQACDKDGNGYLKTAEIRDYVANSDYEDKATLFDALCYYSNVRNPFGTPKNYSSEQAAEAGRRAGVEQIKVNAGKDNTVFAEDSTSVSDSGYGYGGRGRYGGYGRRGGGGGGSVKVSALKQSNYKASKQTYKNIAETLTPRTKAVTADYNTASVRGNAPNTTLPSVKKTASVKIEPPKVKFKEYEV